MLYFIVLKIYVMNPTVYFSIATCKTNGKNYLHPLRSTHHELAKMFDDVEVQETNIQFYNRSTVNFINSNLKSSEFFYSDKYDYDPELKTFKFYTLNVCSDKEYDALQYPSTFDPTKPYKNTDEHKRSIVEMIREDYPCPDISTGFYIEERNWNFLVRNIIQHKNTMLIGPTGTGKTEIIMKICESLGLDCHIYDMGSMQDPLTDLLGSHRLENGSSIFDYAKFVEDVQKPGVILLDELSRAPLMTNNILFPCLDSRRQLPIEIADSHHDRAVKVHPECTFIATANIGSEYSGTNEIDAALLNRFLPIQLNYLPANIELEILKIRTGISNDFATEIVSKFNMIRIAYTDSKLSKSVSTRELIACGELVHDGFTCYEALDFVVAQKFINNGYDNELNIVRKILAEI